MMSAETWAIRGLWGRVIERIMDEDLEAARACMMSLPVNREGRRLMLAVHPDALHWVAPLRLRVEEAFERAFHFRPAILMVRDISFSMPYDRWDVTPLTLDALMENL